MPEFVITIARGFGSGGKTIGRLLAQRLDIDYYDNDLLRLASEESGINIELFGKADERVKANLFKRYNRSYGEKLMAAYRAGFGAKLSPAVLAKLRLAPDTAPIDGGLILRCGPVETNCSLAMLMAENRRETEARVSRILFGDAT